MLSWVMPPSTTAGRRLLHAEAACVAFDAFDRLGFRDVPHFVAHSHTLHNCCVRFVAPSPEAHATLTTSWALPLTPAFLKYIRLRQPEPQQQRSARRNSVLASSLVTPWAFSPRT